MNKFTLAAVCCVAALAVVAGNAGEAHAKRGTVGFGVGTDLRLGVPTSLGNIVVPIHISDSLAIEPEFGFVRNATEQGDNSTSDLNLRLGTGIFFKNAITKKTNIYGGGRLGIIFNSGNVTIGDNEVDTSQTSFFVGGVSGAEFFINDAFSLGGEWGIYFTSIGEEEVDGEDGGDDEEAASQSIISTTTMIYFRYYFM